MFASNLTLTAIAIFGISMVHARAEKLSPENRIDQLIETKLEEMEIEPNTGINDDAFLRRAYLDLAGRIPTLQEAERYQAGAFHGKRQQLIDTLLDSEAYVSHFYHFWADILRINSRLGINETPPAVEYAYRLWLAKALRENIPYDSFARELVSARGHPWENGAIGYYQRDRGMPLENMSNTVRIFLGTRLDCAQCHDHPFDHWTQMDFYKMASFTYGMESQGDIQPNRKAMRAHLHRLRKEAPGNDEDYARKMTRAEDVLHIRVRYVTTRENKRTLTLPHDYQYRDAKPFDPVTAQPMFDSEITAPGGSAVEAYAAWLTSKDNPAFTRVIANRLWKKIFGRGIFEPIDEITDSTYVSNPELMDFLENLMRDLDYDMKAYLGVLCRTRAYQRGTSRDELKPGSPYYFPGPALRRMSAEQTWDSVVGLVLPEVDYYYPNLVRQLAAIDRVRTIYQSLADIPEDQYIASVEELRDTMATNLTRKKLVEEARRKAHTEKDGELFRQKTVELKALEREVADKISYIQNTRHRDVDESMRLASFGMAEMSRDMEGEISPGSGGKTYVVTKRHKPKFPKPPRGLDSDQSREWRARQKAEYDSYLALGSKWARASALDSPAPRGHFLREFGQSDREVIENASSQASVPQSLALMNGPMTEALTNRFGVLGSRLHAAETPELKISLIFQAMLTREPTRRELELARDEVANRGEQAYNDLVWSLLNTRQFLFVP